MCICPYSVSSFIYNVQGGWCTMNAKANWMTTAVEGVVESDKAKNEWENESEMEDGRDRKKRVSENTRERVMENSRDSV